MSDHCHVDPLEKTVSSEEQETITSVSLAVWGMGCPNCAMRVRNGLIALRGVISAEVSHVSATADVLFNPKLLTVFELADAIANAGNDGRHHYQVISSPR